LQTLIAAIFVFGIIIFVHEYGHYLAARRNGIKVLELSLGFGPRLLGWSKDGTDYSLRAIPLGGYCRMLGEDPEEKGEPGNFIEKPLFGRISVVAAGSLLNFALAIFLFFVVHFFLTGVPVEDSTKVGVVEPGTPAYEVGLEEGDEIVAVDKNRVNDFQDIIALINESEGEEVHITFTREGQQQTVQVEPTFRELPDGTTQPMIGIGQPAEKFNFFASIGASFEYIYVFFASIYLTITGQIPADVAGPVGIVGFVGEAAAMGIANLLMLTGLISFSLGFINLLPIPALDGGRLLFLIIEGIRGKAMDPEKEGLIHLIGFAMLLVLILVVTYHDLLRLGIFQ